MSNEIVRYQSLQDIQTIAGTFALTGYFDAKGNSPVEVAKAVTKILAGQEMGFGPFASMKGIYIIQGSPSVSGHLIATSIKRSQKYDYRVKGEITDTKCTIEFFERTAKGMESIGVYTFTADDAKKAGTQNMAKYPRDMLFNRCISAGYKKFCPDALGDGPAVYTPEELGATTNESGDYVESTARIVDAETGEIKPDVQFETARDERLFKRMHATGKEIMGDAWRNGEGRELLKHVTGKESTKDLSNAEMEAVIAQLETMREVPDAEIAIEMA